MTIKLNELMEALGQAQEAQNTLPAMKAEIARLTRALEASQAEASRFAKAAEDIGVRLDTAKTLTAKLTEERDDASFHALELEEKLATITKIVGPALGLVVPPKDEPKPAEPTHVVAASPVSTEVKSEPTSPASASYDWRQDRDSSLNHDASPSEPEVSPSHPSESGQSGSYNNQGASSQYQAASTPPTPNYQGMPWHSKPNGVTIRDFAGGGGEKPYWFKGDDNRTSWT